MYMNEILPLFLNQASADLRNGEIPSPEYSHRCKFFTLLPSPVVDGVEVKPKLISSAFLRLN